MLVRGFRFQLHNISTFRLDFLYSVILFLLQVLKNSGPSSALGFIFHLAESKNHEDSK